MTGRRALAVLFAAAAVASLAWSSVRWSDGTGAVAGIRAHRVDAAARLDSTRADLREAKLERRGFLESFASVPDSVRAYGGSVVLNRQKLFEKRIGLLEATQDGLEGEIARLDAREAQARRGRLAGALPGAVAAVLLAALAAALARTGRKRPVAS